MLKRSSLITSANMTSAKNCEVYAFVLATPEYWILFLHNLPITLVLYRSQVQRWRGCHSGFPWRWSSPPYWSHPGSRRRPERYWCWSLVKTLMPTFLQYLSAKRVSAVSPDCEIRMHTSSLKERGFLNLRDPSPKAEALVTKVIKIPSEMEVAPRYNCWKCGLGDGWMGDGWYPLDCYDY